MANSRRLALTRQRRIDGQSSVLRRIAPPMRGGGLLDPPHASFSAPHKLCGRAQVPTSSIGVLVCRRAVAPDDPMMIDENALVIAGRIVVVVRRVVTESASDEDDVPVVVMVSAVMAVPDRSVPNAGLSHCTSSRCECAHGACAEGNRRPRASNSARSHAATRMTAKAAASGPAMATTATTKSATAVTATMGEGRGPGCRGDYNCTREEKGRQRPKNFFAFGHCDLRSRVLLPALGFHGSQ